jgi:hypothetical protein
MVKRAGVNRMSEYYTVFVKIKDKNGKIVRVHNHYEEDRFRGIGRKEILEKATKYMIAYNKRKNPIRKYILNTIEIKSGMVE